MNKSNGFSMVPKGSFLKTKMEDPLFCEDIIVGSTDLVQKPSLDLAKSSSVGILNPTNLVKQSFGLSGSLKRLMDNLSNFKSQKIGVARPGSSG